MKELDFTMASLIAASVANVASAFRGGENKNVMAGLTFYLYNEVSTMALKSLTGVSHSVANTAKRAVVIIGSAIAFGEDMGFMKALGCSIAIGGTFLYAIGDDIAKSLSGGDKKKKK